MSAAVATGLAITNPLVKYRALVATNVINPDPGQHRLAIYLSKLYERLKDYEPEVEYSHRLDQISRKVQQAPEGKADRSFTAPSRTWRSFIEAKEKRDTLALTRRLTSREAALQLQSPKGLMLHGEVGTGKSMLIDLFADCLPNRKKRRWHFNTFMLETFAKLESLRQARLTNPRTAPGADPDDDYSLLWLAKDMIHNHPILFLDEFQMPDRVASKILTNLMTSFFHLGGVLVATSNRMPEELAKAAGIAFSPPPAPPSGFGWAFGARRESARLSAGYNEFAAFLEVLKARCEVMEMEGGKDYRRIESGTVARKKAVEEEGEKEMWRVNGHEDLQHSVGMAGWEIADQATRDAVDPVGEEAFPQANVLPKHFAVDSSDDAASRLQAGVARATGGLSLGKEAWSPAVMTVYGRVIDIPRAYKGVTMWRFDELCKAAFGPADYITLASNYHTVILTDVPIMNWLMKNEARRLITVLDALYECRCKLFVSAAAGPDDIFFPEEQRKSEEEGDSGDAVYSETLSEVYQDATAPFRPNILTQNPNYAEPDSEPDYTHARLAGLLKADALEDDPPNKPKNPFGRSFGRTDAELERKPVDPDEVRYTATSKRPDFGKTSAFTGEDERFAYKRAQSRLWEMCSAKWWAREEPDWHRPLPVEVRRWEGDSLRIAPMTAGERTLKSEIQMGDSVLDASRDERSFKRVERKSEEVPQYSPFRTAREPPPKFSWMHFFGTMKWGPKAGAWGQGVDGLKDREHKKP